MRLDFGPDGVGAFIGWPDGPVALIPLVMLEAPEGFDPHVAAAQARLVMARMKAETL